jgi:FixJ family two-component response regulator
MKSSSPENLKPEVQINAEGLVQTVFVVDDDPALCKVLDLLLRSVGFDVETFSSVQGLLRRLPFHGNSCIITDLDMPGMNGMELQERLVSAQHLVPLIFMTGHGDIHTGVKAMKKGAVDFLLKPFQREELLAAVRTALEKDRLIREKVLITKAIMDRMNSLTPREREVLIRVVGGQLNKHIASDLGISEATVKVHRGRVMEKMGVTSVAELVKAVDRLPST